MLYKAYVFEILV